MPKVRSKKILHQQEQELKEHMHQSSFKQTFPAHRQAVAQKLSQVKEGLKAK